LISHQHQKCPKLFFICLIFTIAFIITKINALV
jgi:hypothetical protein